MISCCERGAEWNRALELFQEMGKQQVSRTTISYGSMMSAFEKGKQWILALQVMEQMDAAKVRKDAVVHNAAMSACEKCSQWQSAHAILSTMHPKLRDTYSFNAVMAASANARMWEVTIHLLQAMREDSLADSYSYAAAISAYGVQHWAAALALFWTEEVQNLAGPVMFNEILDAVFVEEKISLEIFHLARRHKLFPGLLHNLGDLDLHDLSVGAAFVALRWWLQTSPPGKRLNVITGVGKSRKAWRDADLRAAVAEMLEKMNIRRFRAKIPGRFLVEIPRRQVQQMSRKMTGAFAGIWRTYGLPEEIARDPLLNPDLEGPAQDEVLKEQQRWLMEARARSPRRPRSSSPESRSPRTPRGGREMSPSRHAASPRELIRDEWQRGYHTVGIPLSPRSLKPQSVTLPGVSPRTHKKEKQRVEEEAQLSMASTLMSPKPNTLAALASTKHQTRESPKDGSGPALHVSKSRPLAPPIDTGLTQPLQSPLRSRSPSLLSPGVGRGREDDVEPSDSRRSAQSPNRAGAMADSKQVAAKHQQSLQSKAVGRGREDDVEPSDSRRSAQSPNRSGAMAESEQVAAKHQQSLQSRAVESASEGHFVPFDSRHSPQLGHHVDDPDFFDALEHEDSRPHPREKPANVETQRRRVSDADVDYATQRSPATSGHHSKARESQKLQSQKEASLTQAKSKEIATKPQSVMNVSKKSSNIGRSEPGGAGPIPSPEVMSKAARARSLLYVPAQNDQKAKDGAAKTSGEMSGSMSSTLGMSKKPGRSELQRQNPQNQQKKTSPSSKQTASATLTEEELARRDSSPPSFMCGRSFGHSESILLPLRSTERHVLSLENSPSPTSERGLQDLTRGEQPQILWERSLSPDAKRAHRASQISFGKPEHFDTGDRSTASKSPGRPVTSSVSPRSHGTPSPSGRSTSPYSNRAIYVSDTPWSRPAPSPVRMKGWR
eukprot:symbB.v1.2.017318.t1/scaffold1341.1/size124323/9